ncbi:MAG: inclusion body family protein [Chlorobiales bacterium]|nr:inclusion body family protein [Chlorobiales bacterium]
MSKTINIDVMFDTVTIERDYGGGGSAGSPIGLRHEDAWMVAQKNVVDKGQATADLVVKAKVNDYIQWRSESLSGNTDQAAIIYKIARFSGDQVTSDVEMRVSYPPTPIPDPKNPTSYNAVETQADVHLSCEVLNKGTEGYQVYFYIVNKDDYTGELKTFGYYYWDPTIEAIG